jgi:glyoxylase-like metal-dependent hydrolase (beta-lactamase superfamily II)
MAHRTITVGAVHMTALCDVVGDFPVPLDRAFPDVTEDAWEPHQRRYPKTFSGTNRWRLRVWCFVVRTKNRVVLIDTGVGDAGTPGAEWIGERGQLPNELATAGIQPDDVDVVVLTHLHLDHVGWNVAWDGDQARARFPQARYLVQRADWDLFATEGDENDRAAFERCVRPLQTLGAVELLDGDRVLGPELTAVHTPGHTPGSQSLLVRSGDNAALFWGDVANHPAQVSEPLWCPASDVLPEQARRTRKALLDQIHADRMWLAPAHFPEPFGSVVQEDGERCWSPHAPQHPGCCVSPLLGQEE